MAWAEKSRDVSNYNAFVRAFLSDDLDAMNEYMNQIAGNMFSYFDTGKRAFTDRREKVCADTYREGDFGGEDSEVRICI